jgi:hypothetical protein
MIAVQGVYDGKTIKPLEPIHARANVRVVITFLEESKPLNVPATRLEDVAGCLKWTGPAKTLCDMEHAIELGARVRK